MSEAASATPVIVLTGFLGSGKTTLLNRLLGHPDMGETAVLINEFGEIGLDHLLVREVKEGIVLLSSGCICCTVQGELVDSLGELFFARLQGEIPKFTRVVIETTGLADPAPIIAALVRDPLFKESYRLEGIVTTVDAALGSIQLDEHVEAVKQAAMADRIVLTKSDIAEAEAIEALGERLRRLNPAAPIIRAVQGAVAPDVLLDAGLFNAKTKSLEVQRWLREEAYTEHAGHGHDGHDDHGHGGHGDHGPRPDLNRHDHHIATFCMTLEEPVAFAEFEIWLNRLLSARGKDFLRVKGIVNTTGKDRPVVIHCVHHIRHPPITLPAWPDDDRRSRIVFITRDVSRQEVEDSFANHFASRAAQ